MGHGGFGKESYRVGQISLVFVICVLSARCFPLTCWYLHLHSQTFEGTSQWEGYTSL